MVNVLPRDSGEGGNGGSEPLPEPAPYGVAELTQEFFALGAEIRSGSVDVGRSWYARALLQGVAQARCLGLPGISAVELGVAAGDSLLDLIKAARLLSERTGVLIDVYGFDSFQGLPPPQGCADHPEVWGGGFFATELGAVKARLQGGARLIVGDLAETVPRFEQRLRYPLGFVALDVDLYSSAKIALQILLFDSSSLYLPAVPMYVDDVEQLLTFNSWCGEAKAIAEFNELNQFRKIERKQWSIERFHVCHVLDHPVRTGAVKPLVPFELRDF